MFISLPLVVNLQVLSFIFIFIFSQYLKVPADRENVEDYEILEENIKHNRYNNQVSIIFKIIELYVCSYYYLFISFLH